MAAGLVWFRQDLRLNDNAALAAAVERNEPVVPLYILDDRAEGRWQMGAAARSWLHHSLLALDEALRERGSRLIVRVGDTESELRRVIAETKAQRVYWNRRYEPSIRRRDAELTASLQADSIAAAEFNGALLHEPEEIQNLAGGPFQVFTPFWRRCRELPVERPIKLGGGKLRRPKSWPASIAISDLRLRPRLPWDGGFYRHWTPGESGAKKRLTEFVRDGLEGYANRRDFPAQPGGSMLSPHLHFGEITPRQVWTAIEQAGRKTGVFPPNRGAAVFLNEVGWREFAYHLLVHFPHTAEQPLRAAFARFPWASDRGGRRLRAWQRGQTGYPIVDAGVRQLWHTGWMHNRVRMIVASFLVKHLRLPWTEGAAWFWDTLVDADLANNTLGWQWSAGCGADAAPYFRIFAPVIQGQKFDSTGAYVRQWLPELARLPDKYIHAPWTAPIAALTEAGVRLGRDYPLPIVDHATARAEALAAFRKLREAGRT